MIEVAWFFQRIRRFLYAVGQWEILRRLAERVILWAESTYDPEILADSLESLINVCREQEEFVRGMEWLERVQNSLALFRNEVLQADIWLNQLWLSYRRNISPKEETDFLSHATQAISIFLRNGKTERAVRALNALGNLHLQKRRFAEATQSYLEAFHLLEDFESKITGAPQWHAILRGNLGLVAASNAIQKHVRSSMTFSRF